MPVLSKPKQSSHMHTVILLLDMFNEIVLAKPPAKNPYRILKVQSKGRAVDRPLKRTTEGFRRWTIPLQL